MTQLHIAPPDTETTRAERKAAIMKFVDEMDRQTALCSVVLNDSDMDERQFWIYMTGLSMGQRGTAKLRAQSIKRAWRNSVAWRHIQKHWDAHFALLRSPRMLYLAPAGERRRFRRYDSQTWEYQVTLYG
jgi:hypothetical protein